jgi:DNA modification methylase
MKQKPSQEQLCLSLLKEPSLHLLDKPRQVADFSCYSPYLNQALQEFVRLHRTDGRPSHVTAPSGHISAGKNTYAYDAHTYHTKVPPEAIVRLIKHYTEPGDLILDPFCGSGMTGVAALQLGRKSILIDLSPAATFIALNFVTPVDWRKYMEAVETILTSTHDEETALYGTYCRVCGKLVPMEYMVWSYGAICPHCSREFVLWDVARDEREDIRESKIKSEFSCPSCGKRLVKRTLQRTKLYPVQVGYRCCDSGLRESQVVPDEHDLEVIKASDSVGVPKELWYPTVALPEGLNTRQAIVHGLDSLDDLYTTRNLRAVARLWDIARRWRDGEFSLKVMFTVTSLYQRVTRLSEFRFWGGSGNMANYNVPMIFNEQNVFRVFRRKARTIRDYLATTKPHPDTVFCISTQSATDLSTIPDNSIDYIFTDPPFGGNINYSEMNYLWEAWLNVFTNTTEEVIINRAQNKTLETYRELMTKSLREMHRVLKPGQWLTLVFHNSSARVWAAIQDALWAGGFAIMSTQILDKRHGTFKQFVSDNAVGYDLMLHCQKYQRDSSTVQSMKAKSSSRASIREFVEHIVQHHADEFIVRYLHVNRRNELDTRKLYSLWLKEQIEAGKIVDLDYEEFRRIVRQIIEGEMAL